MKLLIYTQTSTVQPWNFTKSINKSIWHFMMWIITHAGIKLTQVSEGGHLW